MEFTIKNLVSVILVAIVTVLLSGDVSAHATVKPATAGVGAYTDFTLGVPSEKDAATTSVKLFLPEGINSVTPVVKPGWSVQIIDSDKTGEPDDDGNVKAIPEAIAWSGGSIPGHQKDFFVFSTQVPSDETELIWKVEQTYSDGSVISWNLAPGEQPKDESGSPDFSKSGPYSKTMVVNDLKTSEDQPMDSEIEESSNSKYPLYLSLLAVVVSGFAIGVALRK